MSGAYERKLDAQRGVVLYVEFRTDRRQVVDYAVILTVAREGGQRTVRTYDGSHGVSEMHRHSADGRKQPGEVFHHGTLGEGMRAAIAECETGCEVMIEGWQR